MYARRFLLSIGMMLMCLGGRVEIATAQTPAPAPSCERPSVDARTVSAARPVTPPIAAQQHIAGEVIVQITLDENSKIVSAVIVKSPSSLLNNAALQAARESTFATAIRNCVPVGGSYNFVVFFGDPNAPRPGPPATMIAYFSGAWNCATADGSPSFLLFGLDATKSVLIETDASGNANGDLFTTSVYYSRIGNELHATRPSRPLAYGVSSGWSGNRLVFHYTSVPDPSAAETVTYDRIDADAFVRTSATPAVGAAVDPSVEHCQRIAPLAPR